MGGFFLSRGRGVLSADLDYVLKLFGCVGVITFLGETAACRVGD